MTLIEQITEAGPRLTQRVLGEMYANPFWKERFGDRGEHHANRDGDYHLKYLREALQVADTQLFTSYATWLREVLVSRGMCSRHLAENFDRLATAIDEEAWDGRSVAVEILRAGAAALTYRTGEPGALDARRTEIASAAANQLYAAHPEWPSDDNARRRCVDDLEYHLSYVADAIAFSQPDRLNEYVRFISAFLGRRNVPRDYLREALRSLATAADGAPTAARYLTDAAEAA